LDYLEVLNLSDPELAGLLDLENVATVGHSLGGATVLEVSKGEKRIKAAILLDPSFHLIHRDGFASSIPILLLRQEASTYGEMASDMDKKIACDYIDGQRYTSTTFINIYFYRVKGAQHMSFSDVPLHYGDNHAVSIHAVVTEAALAFLEEVFQNGRVPHTMPMLSSESVVPINSEGDPI
jgi:dienelactone hydrolase